VVTVDQASDHDVVGTVGVVTIAIRMGKPGEVVLKVRGGTEAYAAWSDEPVAKAARVVVVDQTGAHSVQVTPL
jgi:membrane protein implicated in regulation of membrane protease activity